MAVTKSDIVTNADNLDTQNEKGQYSRQLVITAHEALPIAADNDVVLFHEIPVDALIDSIILNSDDAGTTGDINIGFYPGPGSGVAITAATDAVDEDAIGTAIDINAAALANVEIRFETQNISSINQKAWELAGLTSQPDYGTFYIAGTMSEASTAIADITLCTKYRV